jgi:oligopeptide/dipeptide ABC transporter ATP-binding protein
MKATGEVAVQTEKEGPVTLLLFAYVFSVLTVVFWLILPLVWLNDPDMISQSFAGPLLSKLGWFLIVPACFALATVSHTGRLRSALKRQEIGKLRELNSLVWGVLSFFLANPITGALLMLARRPLADFCSSKPVDIPKGTILVVSHLTKLFPVRRTFAQVVGRRAEAVVHAVDDVSFRIDRGEVAGLAGESGSGKTTVLRLALGLLPVTSGSIFFEGEDISKMTAKELKKLRTKMQVVFQDPYESVNPRMTVFEIVAEGLYVNNLVSSREEAIERVEKALRDVQLTPPTEYLYRHPHELSGGQRQRVAIARALVLGPQLIMADEPVSMLDVSVRAEVMNVLLSVRQKQGISVVMVTHDLALSKDVVDKLAIMYLGKIVEQGPAQTLVSSPYHPYTQALVAAVPVPDPTGPRIRILAKGEIPTNIAPPSACRFHPRCPFAKPICSETEPPILEVTPGRQVACHFWKESLEAFSGRAAAEQAVDHAK